MIEWSSGRGARTWVRIALAISAAGAAVPATAQQNEQPAAAQGQIGPPQLRDFQLTPRERIVTQPRPAPAPPAEQAVPTTAPATTTQREASPRPAPARAPAAQTAPAGRVQAVPATPAAPIQTLPQAPETAPVTSTQTAPRAQPPATFETAPATPAAAPVGPGDEAPAQGVPLWLLLVGGLGLGIALYALLIRRRGRAAPALPAPAAATAGPRAPRPDPLPRAWLEVELKPERTTADPAESAVEFEMTVRNTGGSPAKNIQLQAKLICSTPDQDKEITAFQRMKPGEHRTLTIPDLPAGEELTLKGRVDVKQEDMKAMRVEQRLLFVPLVAVNAFYDWGTVRTGQTSRSFLIGRERADSPTKMAPFRLDLGPRVYRTLGQRPYRVERRV